VRAVVLLAVVVAVGALASAGCRSDEELQPPDLSSASLYCPSDPPVAGGFVCDPTSIPYCTYPAQGTTCSCNEGDGGLPTLQCGAEIAPDDGLPTGTGT
jgi:hypothetical protein